MLPIRLDDVRYGQRIYEAPSESLWRGNIGGQSVSIFKLKRPEEEYNEGFRLHAEISKNPDIRDYFVYYLGADSSTPKIIVYEPIRCQLRTYIEQHGRSPRNKVWFYNEGLQVLKLLTLSVRLLHRNRILHGNITLNSIFLTDTRIVKIGDFRLACRINGTRRSPRYLDDMESLCKALLCYVCNKTREMLDSNQSQKECQDICSTLHPRLFDTVMEGAHLTAKELEERLNMLDDTSTVRQVYHPEIEPLPAIRVNSVLGDLRHVINSPGNNEARARELILQFISLREVLKRDHLSVRFIQ